MQALRVPMLVYLITKDVKLAGLYVFKWFSKVLFYAIGGTFLNKFTLKKHGEGRYIKNNRIFNFIIFLYEP